MNNLALAKLVPRLFDVVSTSASGWGGGTGEAEDMRAWNYFTNRVIAYSRNRINSPKVSNMYNKDSIAKNITFV